MRLLNSEVEKDEHWQQCVGSYVKVLSARM